MLDRIRCATCGEEHDLSDMEPTFARPDAFIAVPVEERERRTRHSDDWCVVRGEPGERDRYFYRAVLPVPVRGEGRDVNWGVWVEVAERDYGRIADLWEAPDQHEAPPFAAALANALADYPPTSGLPGTLHLVSASRRPVFRLDPALDHPLAAEQRDGVYAERVLEWLARQLH